MSIFFLGLLCFYVPNKIKMLDASLNIILDVNILRLWATFYDQIMNFIAFYGAVWFSWVEICRETVSSQSW